MYKWSGVLSIDRKQFTARKFTENNNDRNEDNSPHDNLIANVTQRKKHNASRFNRLRT